MSQASEAEATGQRTSLGVVVAPLTEAERERRGHNSGVRVMEVAGGSLGDEAGIQSGDVLVVVGSVTLRRVEDLARAETAIEAGQPVSIVFSRDNGRVVKMVRVEPPPIPESQNAQAGEVKASEAEESKASEAEEAKTNEAEEEVATAPIPVIDETPPAPPTPAPIPVIDEPPPTPPTIVIDRVGLACANVDAQLTESLGLGEAEGAVVRIVVGESMAADAGIRAGDVIVMVGDETVEGAEHLKRLITEASLPVVVSLWHRGDDQPIKVRLRAAPAEVQSQEPVEETLRVLREEIRILRREIETLRDEKKAREKKIY
jgi:S1-C subfamily serine protease